MFHGFIAHQKKIFSFLVVMELRLLSYLCKKKMEMSIIYMALDVMDL